MRPLYKLCFIMKKFRSACNFRRHWPECVGLVNRTFNLVLSTGGNEVVELFVLLVQ